MARITNNTPATASDINWIDDASLDSKVDLWKSKGYTLDSVIKSLRVQDFKIKVGTEEFSVNIGKLNRAWHAEIVAL